MKKMWRRFVFRQFMWIFENEIEYMIRECPIWGFMWCDLMGDVCRLGSEPIYPKLRDDLRAGNPIPKL